MLERIDVRLRGVVDVGGVDQVVAAADQPQAAGAGAFHQCAAGSGCRPAPQISRGRSATVASAASLAASTACSAMILVVGVRRLEAFAVRHLVGAAAFDRMGGAMGRRWAWRCSTSRPMPCARQAAITLRVPITLASMIALRSCPRRRPSRRCGSTASQPSANAASTASRSARSPCSWRTPMRVQRRVVAAVEAGDLVPARDAGRGTAPGPRKPPPPVTRIFMRCPSRVAPPPTPPASRDRSWRCGGCPPERPGWRRKRWILAVCTKPCAEVAQFVGDCRRVARARPAAVRTPAPASARPSGQRRPARVRSTSRMRVEHRLDLFGAQRGRRVDHHALRLASAEPQPALARRTSRGRPCGGRCARCRRAGFRGSSPARSARRG